MSIEVTDSAFNLDSALAKLGYSSAQIAEITSSDVLLLPEDIESSESYFSDKSVSIKKAIEKQLKVAVLTRQGAKSHYHARRAADIVVPLLVFLGLQAFDVSKGIIASWIYDRYLRLRYRGRIPNVRFTGIIIDDKRKLTKMVTCEGPADKVSETLRRSKFEF